MLSRVIIGHRTWRDPCAEKEAAARLPQSDYEEEEEKP